ncbi:MAG: LPS export ABC transporter periplasmic protein LptC [Bacteroidales bacterium]|nr:LPS export ABC transporter periplasmic protein LptC [Bacteroidales bacterium]
MGYEVEIAYTDSGLLKGKILTPELQMFEDNDGGYIEFPKGIHVIFINDSGVETSHITSKYAINYPKKQLWIARNNVVAINELEGKELYTEELFWDQKTEKVYSNVFRKL